MRGYDWHLLHWFCLNVKVANPYLNYVNGILWYIPEIYLSEQFPTVQRKPTTSMVGKCLNPHSRWTHKFLPSEQREKKGILCLYNDKAINTGWWLQSNIWFINLFWRILWGRQFIKRCKSSVCFDETCSLNFVDWTRLVTRRGWGWSLGVSNVRFWLVGQWRLAGHSALISTVISDCPKRL